MPERVATKIDEDRLDQESMEVPDLIEEYAVLLAKEKKRLKDTTDALELLASRLKLKMRQNPEQYDLPKKPAVELIKAAVTMHPKYQRRLKELNEIQYRCDLLRANVQGLEGKKRMLENISELHKIGYFSDVHKHRDPEREERLRHAKKSAARKLLNRRKD